MKVLENNNYNTVSFRGYFWIRSNNENVSNSKRIISKTYLFMFRRKIGLFVFSPNLVTVLSFQKIFKES